MEKTVLRAVKLRVSDPIVLHGADAFLPTTLGERADP